mgnify:CR=1 FL=1
MKIVLAGGTGFLGRFLVSSPVLFFQLGGEPQESSEGADTRDDAAGEVFDKVAAALGLSPADLASQPIEEVSTGLPFLVVPVRTRRATSMPRSTSFVHTVPERPYSLSLAIATASASSS